MVSELRFCRQIHFIVEIILIRSSRCQNTIKYDVVASKPLIRNPHGLYSPSLAANLALAFYEEKGFASAYFLIPSLHHLGEVYVVSKSVFSPLILRTETDVSFFTA